MNAPRERLSEFGVVLAILILPLLGAALAGRREMADFFRFPPALDIPTSYLRFSWGAVAAALLPVLLVGASWMANRSRVSVPPAVAENKTPALKFPAWGWIAVSWTFAWWALAWTRWTWFEPLQRYTFFPLWLGFILTVNALVERRTGTCFMRRAPRRWLLLFGASALFWWIFEWLNRFVRNWHYLGVEDVSALNYAVHATVCFSTVLPAVAAVAEWLNSFRGWRIHTSRGPAWSGLSTRPSAKSMIVVGALALLLTGAMPDLFYPALWVAPLLLFVGRSSLRGHRGVAHELATGHWQRIATWISAALVCGFFWELWNWRSFAKWIYTVPGVDVWHVFEMPVLGYLGYLPFGLECMLIAERISHPRVAQEV